MHSPVAYVPRGFWGLKHLMSRGLFNRNDYFILLVLRHLKNIGTNSFICMFQPFGIDCIFFVILLPRCHLTITVTVKTLQFLSFEIPNRRMYRSETQVYLHTVSICINNEVYLIIQQSLHFSALCGGSIAKLLSLHIFIHTGRISNFVSVKKNQ